MLEAITSAMTSIVGWAGDVLSAIVSTDGELSAVLPVIGISIGLGIVGWAIRTIKSLVWGF